METASEERAFVPKEIHGNPDMNRYILELRDDMTLTQMNLKEKSLTVSAIRTKWLNYYFLEKSNLKRIKEKRDEIVKSKVGSGVRKSILPLKSEDLVSKSDENVKLLDSMAENVRANIDFLERAMNILNDFPFTIKNSVDILKLERM